VFIFLPPSSRGCALSAAFAVGNRVSRLNACSVPIQVDLALVLGKAEVRRARCYRDEQR